MKQRLKDLVAEYGRIAIATYLVLFVLSLAGFAIAIRSGVEIDSVAGEAGTWTAAWLATKLIQPLRIGATLVLTPMLATVLRRRPVRPDGERSEP